jgi:hypothetical protein
VSSGHICLPFLWSSFIPFSPSFSSTKFSTVHLPSSPHLLAWAHRLCSYSVCWGYTGGRFYQRGMVFITVVSDGTSKTVLDLHIPVIILHPGMFWESTPTFWLYSRRARCLTFYVSPYHYHLVTLWLSSLTFLFLSIFPVSISFLYSLKQSQHLWKLNHIRFPFFPSSLLLHWKHKLSIK